jgi:hypothetical protein
VDSGSAVTSRNFRKRLSEFLIEFKEDTAEIENHPREFDDDPRSSTDPDCTGDLAALFAKSGLDPTAPGHWQLLLVAVVNFATLQERGPDPKWTTEAKQKFLREMYELKRKYPEMSRTKLCEALKKKHANKEPYFGTADSLRTKFQLFLQEWRDESRAGQADPKVNRWIAEFSKL